MTITQKNQSKKKIKSNKGKLKKRDHVLQLMQVNALTNIRIIQLCLNAKYEA